MKFSYPLVAIGLALAGLVPQLLFLSCRMTTETAGSRLQVLRAEMVAGTLKVPDPEADAPDFVRVTQLDGQGQPLAQMRVAHPLRRRVEHVATDRRTFQRSEVTQPTAEFFYQYQLRPEELGGRAAGVYTLLLDVDGTVTSRQLVKG